MNFESLKKQKPFFALLGLPVSLGCGTVEYCHFSSAPAAWSEPADGVRLEPRFCSKPLGSVAWVCALLPQTRCSFILGSECDVVLIQSTSAFSHTENLAVCDLSVCLRLNAFSCVYICVNAVIFAAKCQQLAVYGHEWTVVCTSCIPNHLVGKYIAVGKWFDHFTRGMFRYDEMKTKQRKLHYCSTTFIISSRGPSRVVSNIKKHNWMSFMTGGALSGHRKWLSWQSDISLSWKVTIIKNNFGCEVTSILRDFKGRNTLLDILILMWSSRVYTAVYMCIRSDVQEKHG